MPEGARRIFAYRQTRIIAFLSHILTIEYVVMTKNMGKKDRDLRLIAAGILILAGIVTNTWWLDPDRIVPADHLRNRLLPRLCTL